MPILNLRTRVKKLKRLFLCKPFDDQGVFEEYMRHIMIFNFNFKLVIHI